MVQEFNVACCFSCLMFQVQQVKKSTNKWVCKICNEKQTLKQVFFRGSGKECREQCQQRNMNAQQSGVTRDEQNLQESSNPHIIQHGIYNEDIESESESGIKKNEMTGESKWSLFVEEKDLNQSEDSGDEPNVNFRGEFKSKRTRTLHTKSKSKTGLSSNSESNKRTHNEGSRVTIRNENSGSAHEKNEQNSNEIGKQVSTSDSDVNVKRFKFTQQKPSVDKKINKSIVEENDEKPVSKWSKFLQPVACHSDSGSDGE